MSESHGQFHVTSVCVGALIGVGHFLTQYEHLFASISYIAAILLAVVSLVGKFRGKK